MMQHPQRLNRLPIVLCCLSPLAAALAQTSEQSNTTYPAVEVKDTVLEYRQFEKVEITGSAILAKEAKEALPIQIIDRREIERSGARSLDELIQRLPVMSNFLEQGLVVGTSQGGPATAAIHGNQSGTLVLLNGRRLPYYGSQTLVGERAIVDLNFIPLVAIEKIEILTDGASSRYGSDAISGVVNVITKSQLQGFAISTDYTAMNGGAGNGSGMNLSWGSGRLERDGYSLRSYFSANTKNTLMGGDHSETSQGATLYLINGNTYWNRSVNTTFYSSPGRSYIDSKGEIRNIYYDANLKCESGWYELVKGECQHNVQDKQTIYPSTQDKSFYSQAERVFDNGWVISAEILLKNYTQVFSETVVPFGDYYPLVVNSLDSTGERSYLINGQPWGPIQRINKNEMRSAGIGIKGEFLGWDFIANISAGQHFVHRAYSSGLALAENRNFTVLPTEVTLPASQYSAETLAKFSNARRLTERVIDDGKTKLTNFSWMLSREITETEYGPVSLGLGLDVRNETVWYRQGPESKNRPDLDGQRSNEAFYSELNAPITEKIDTTISIRRDHYSDFGGITTGKMGWKWKPEKEWLIRGSWGTGFRAPTLGQLIPKSTYYINHTDPVYGDIPMYNTGNPELKPEKSQQWTLGLRFEPSNQWSFGADMWNTHISDTFGSLTGQQIMNDPDLKAKYFINNQLLINNTNVGMSLTNGIDYDVQWREPTEWGRIRMNLRGTHVLKSEKQATDQVEAESNLGRYSNTTLSVIPRNLLSISLFLEQSNSSLGTVLHYRSGNSEQVELIGQDGSILSDVWRVPSYWTLDFFGRWTISKNLTFSANVINIFDRLPPFRVRNENVLNGIDTRYGDYYGRNLKMKLEYKF